MGASRDFSLDQSVHDDPCGLLARLRRPPTLVNFLSAGPRAPALGVPLIQRPQIGRLDV